VLIHSQKFSIQKPAASINSADGKNKDFFRVDLEVGDSFFIIYLIGFLRLEGESRLKIERMPRNYGRGQRRIIPTPHFT
jgi:hypothetical protein